MKINYAAGQRGLIKMILIIVIALLVISYFGINLRALVNSPTTQDNVTYVASSTVNIWNGYLKVPVTAAWDLFVQYIWTPAIENLKNGKLQGPGLTSSSTPSI